MNFWNQLESKQLNQETIKQTLIKKLGEPNNQLASNCLQEISKKITSYYQEDQPKNYTTYTLIGSLTSPEQILERKFREGKRMRETYYVLQVGKEQLQATEAELEPQQWTRIKQLAILNQELVFKYRKFYTNKQLLGFYPAESYQENMGKASMGQNKN